MVSEARKKAAAKYNREKMVQRVVRFSPNERDLLAHLDAQPTRRAWKRTARPHIGDRFAFRRIPRKTCGAPKTVPAQEA